MPHRLCNYNFPCAGAGPQNADCWSFVWESGCPLHRYQLHISMQLPRGDSAPFPRVWWQIQKALLRALWLKWGPGLREIELVLCVWLTKCVANSVADCKETNRKSRRRLGDALEGLGIGDPPEWLRAAQLLHGATLHWLLCGPKCIRAADPHSPWSSSYIYTYILYIYMYMHRCTSVYGQVLSMQIFKSVVVVWWRKCEHDIQLPANKC